MILKESSDASGLRWEIRRGATAKKRHCDRAFRRIPASATPIAATPSTKAPTPSPRFGARYSSTTGPAARTTIYEEYWAAYDVPRHLYHFSPQSMKVLIEKHGMKLLQCKPMWYDSFYVSMLSSKYKKGRTNLITAFFNGLRSNSKALGDVKKCSSVIYIIGK